MSGQKVILTCLFCVCLHYNTWYTSVLDFICIHIMYLILAILKASLVMLLGQASALSVCDIRDSFTSTALVSASLGTHTLSWLQGITWDFMLLDTHHG